MRKLIRNALFACAGLSVTPASAQEIRHAETLVIASIEPAGRMPELRVLRYDPELLAEQLRGGGVAVPAVEGAAGPAGCLVVDGSVADALTNEVACGGGEIESRDPRSVLEDALAPQVDAGDAVRLRSNDDDDDSDHIIELRDALRNPQSAPRDYTVTVGVNEDGDLVVGGCSGTTCGTLNDILGDDETEEDDNLSAYEQAQRAEAMEAAEEEVLQMLLELTEQLEKEDDESDETPAEDDGETPADGETPTDGEDPAEGEDPADGPEGRPNPEDDGFDVPAECEAELEARFGEGVDPIDPSPEDTPETGGAFVACFGDALVLEIMKCEADLAGRPTRDGGSLCRELGESGASVGVPMLTRNDLVTDPSPVDARVTPASPVIVRTPAVAPRAPRREAAFVR